MHVDAGRTTFRLMQGSFAVIGTIDVDAGAIAEERFYPAKVKYPRTHHLPWSPGITENDRIMPSLDAFHGRCVIVTEKMDGENTSRRTACVGSRGAAALWSWV